ncbi:MAG: phosphoribosylformylglycinamidine synthase subunit PurS [Bacillota bacterium]|nr:phosphoribosylformylglycinamidine synthase subunit PurS [Bacillota bacterium]
MWRAKIFVTLREGVLDPQGQAVRSGLMSQGFQAVSDVRIGKYMEVTVEATSTDEASAMVRAMCERLLANPVMEDYNFTTEEVQ